MRYQNTQKVFSEITNNIDTEVTLSGMHTNLDIKFDGQKCQIQASVKKLSVNNRAFNTDALMDDIDADLMKLVTDYDFAIKKHDESFFDMKIILVCGLDPINYYQQRLAITHGVIQLVDDLQHQGHVKHLLIKKQRELIH